jgi:transcription termination/antitermination protein NusA
MNKEILLVVDVVSNEKDVEKEVIFKALEAALESVTRKKHGGEIDARVTINRSNGDYASYRRWKVVEDPSDDTEAGHDKDRELPLSEARKLDAAAAVGGFVEQPMASIEFGRIAAQTAKQVIVQKVREAERAKVVEAYQGRKGDLVTGVVKKVERGSLILDLGGNAEALVAREDMIPKESVRVGDRMRGYLYDVRSELRGPQLFISRTRPELLIELFKLEVPEVGEGLIEIIGAARDPGVRAKIAVRTRDQRLDPVGACVGMRGSRVQAVSNELNGERVDIILWNENPAQYVINAMSPAQVVSIVVDEESRSMIVAVEEENLSQAIGRGGQNVRLASELTGWELNVMNEQEAAKRSEEESRQLLAYFKEKLDVDEEVANILVQEGFSTLEEVAYVPLTEMQAIQEFDDDIVNELRERAREVLLTQAIAKEEAISDQEPAEDLLTMEGMERALAYDLARRGILTMEDLAEQSVDDLMEIDGMDEERAAQLIMTARAPWFAEAQG